MRRRQREQLVLDVWRSFDDLRRGLNEVWPDGLPPSRPVVERIVEQARVDVGRRMRRALLQKRWLGRRLKPQRHRFTTDAQPDPHRL